MFNRKSIEHCFEKNGYTGWRVFNLARNGGKLTSSIYIYSRILDLHPEVVVYADSSGYYDWENAGASELQEEHYTFADRVFKGNPEVDKAWQDYIGVLKKKWPPAER